MGSGGEATDDAGSLPAIHKSNNHLLPNGDGGRAPVRIPVPPVTRKDDLLHNHLGFRLHDQFLLDTYRVRQINVSQEKERN